MKVLLFSDNHFCKVGSILNRRGNKYFERLENQIKSINWLEKVAVEKGCSEVWCLGDFFNKPDLYEEEITALKDIQWNSLPHRFIVGNHESGQGDLCYNSVKVLEKPNFEIINKVEIKDIEGKSVVFVPYFSELTKVTLEELFTGHADIVLSHNTIAGIQMGPIITTLGFEQEEILNKCNLFINGHLHNGTWVKKDRILNIGNLTGFNFSEDATKYSHNVLILDTNSGHIEFIENPYAYNFYKLEINSERDLEQIFKLKYNSVLSIKCLDKYVDDLKQCLADEANRIVNYRIITVFQKVDNTSEEAAEKLELNVNPVDKFIELCKVKFTDSQILEEELAEIYK